MGFAEDRREDRPAARVGWGLATGHLVKERDGDSGSAVDFDKSGVFFVSFSGPPVGGLVVMLPLEAMVDASLVASDFA